VRLDFGASQTSDNPRPPPILAIFFRGNPGRFILAFNRLLVLVRQGSTFNDYSTSITILYWGASYDSRMTLLLNRIGRFYLTSRAFPGAIFAISSSSWLSLSRDDRRAQGVSQPIPRATGIYNNALEVLKSRFHMKCDSRGAPFSYLSWEIPGTFL
jgi:hypothetical protein